MVGVARAHVSEDQSPGAEARLEQLEHRHVEVVGAIEEQQIDLGVELGERLERVSDPNLDKLLDPCVDQILRRGGRLLGQQLGGDDRATAEVAERAGEMDRRVPERGAELDDQLRASGEPQRVQQLPDLGLDRERSGDSKLRSLAAVELGPELGLALAYAPAVGLVLRLTRRANASQYRLDAV